MIAFSNTLSIVRPLPKPRGRPVGSKKNNPSLPPGMCIAGAATSAAKMNRRPGLIQASSLWLYVPGEGFIRWSEIELQVEEAYLQWRRRKAMQGVLIHDKEEAREIDITGGRVKGPVRRNWLKDWGARHAALCRLANVENIFSHRRQMNQGSSAEAA